MFYTRILNVVIYAREFSKWGAFDLTINTWLLRSPTNSACMLLYGWQCWADSAQLICNFYLSYVIFATIVQKKKLEYEYDPRYFRYMAIYFWVHTITWTMIMTFGPKFIPKKGCGLDPSSIGFIIAGVSECGIFFFIIAYLIGRSLKYIREVYKSVSATRKEKAMIIVNIRIISVVFLHVIPRVMWHGAYILNTQSRSTSAVTLNNYIYALHSVYFFCAMMDNIIMLFANKPLKKFLKKKLYQLTNKSLLSSSEDRINIDKIEIDSTTKSSSKASKTSSGSNSDVSGGSAVVEMEEV